jgi:hypothetical protein
LKPSAHVNYSEVDLEDEEILPVVKSTSDHVKVGFPSMPPEPSIKVR